MRFLVAWPACTRFRSRLLWPTMPSRVRQRNPLDRTALGCHETMEKHKQSRFLRCRHATLMQKKQPHGHSRVPASALKCVHDSGVRRLLLILLRLLRHRYRYSVQAPDPRLVASLNAQVPLWTAKARKGRAPPASPLAERGSKPVDQWRPVLDDGGLGPPGDTLPYGTALTSCCIRNGHEIGETAWLRRYGLCRHRLARVTHSRSHQWAGARGVAGMASTSLGGVVTAEK